MTDIPCKSCDFPFTNADAFPLLKDGSHSDKEWPVCADCMLIAILAGWKTQERKP